MTDALRNANLGLRFMLELGALAAVGYWGWTAANGLLRPILAAAAAGAVAVVWALFISPKPTFEVAGPLRLALEFCVWAAAGGALAATGRRAQGLAFVAVAVASGSLNYAWR